MRKRILVVDDDRHLRRMLHMQLHDAGFDIVEMEDGMQALHWVIANEADLVVLDVSMPEMDGIEFAHELKQRHPHTPILGISAGEEVMSKEFCLRMMKSLGATETLSKPFDLADFMKTVQRLLAAAKPIPNERFQPIVR